MAYAVLALAVIVLCVEARNLQAEDILRYTPENPILAALMLTVMTTAAAFIPIFPMMLFYFAAGILFSFWAALAVGAIGIFTSTAVMYFVGRQTGSGYIDKLIPKYPKLAAIDKWRKNNDVFMTYVIRVSGLPVNLVSTLLGSMNIRFPFYVLGTFIGMIPGLISCVLIGNQVKGEFSWTVIALIVAVNAGAFAVAFIYNRITARKAER